MAAYNFIKYMNKKLIKSRLMGGPITLDLLEENDYFIILNLYDGLIGKLIQKGINPTVKWLNHPEKTMRAEWISSKTEVVKYRYE